jgi:hypothetical protein
MEAAVATEIATLLTHGLYKSTKIELSGNRAVAVSEGPEGLEEAEVETVERGSSTG